MQDESLLEEVTCIFELFMRYKVHVHLKMFSESVQWGLRALRACYEFTVHTSVGDGEANLARNEIIRTQEFRIDDIESELFQIVASNSLFTSAIADIQGLLQKAATSPRNEFSKIMASLLSKLQFSFGAKCLSELNYSEAVSAYLSTNPVSVREAVHAAKLLQDWGLAIAIMGKYENLMSVEEDENLSVQSLAQELVSDYKAMLEQGEYDDDGFGNFQPPNLEVDPLQYALSPCTEPEKSFEAARMCVDYLDDTEGAIAILLLAQKWVEAVNLSLRKKRTDLLSEDICTGKCLSDVFSVPEVFNCFTKFTTG